MIYLSGDSLPLRTGPRATHCEPPLRVAVIDSHELVLTGAMTLLSRYPERVQLLEWPDCSEADVVLYGVDDETVVGHDAQLHALLRTSSATVLSFGWNPESPSALLAQACGVHGFVDQRLPAAELVMRVELLHHTRGCGRQTPFPGDGECHPGVESAGLSKREIEVLSLVAKGESNREIADALFLSVNTVKTYVRSAYRKIDVTRRSQAVIWASRHGLGACLDQSTPLAQVDAQGA